MIEYSNLTEEYGQHSLLSSAHQENPTDWLDTFRENIDNCAEDKTFCKYVTALFETLRIKNNAGNIPNLINYRRNLAQVIHQLSFEPNGWYDLISTDLRLSEEMKDTSLLILKSHAVCSGILHSDELKMIEEGVFPTNIYPDNEYKKLLVSREKIKQQIQEWKKEGFEIVGFPGAFDPPTEIHLAVATQAIVKSQIYGKKIKILFILDGNNLIRRKTTSLKDKRPRVPLVQRRRTLESFWQVAGSCESAVQSEYDTEGYINEYKELLLDYILITIPNDVNSTPPEKIVQILPRLKTLQKSKVSLLSIDEITVKGLSSTEIMEKFRSTKW